MKPVRKDIRIYGVLLVFLVVPLSAWLIGQSTATAPGMSVGIGGTPRGGEEPFAGLRSAESAEPPVREVVPIDEPLKSSLPMDAAGRALADARNLIKAKQFDAAIRRLDEDRLVLRSQPDAYIQLGLALEGRGDPATARDFFAKAIDMDPSRSEAYWGFATTSEALGDLESALGAMRGFLHTDPNPDPNRLRIAQARSAIWEWEARLGRGPWGPSKGVIPGLRPDQQRRDGNGVGGMMPVPGTKRADGSWTFEIKHGKRYKLFEEDAK
jgi:tetratricopeptide (TPR) repeat protein